MCWAGGISWGEQCLEVDDDQEDEDGRHDVGDVRQVLAVEGLLERAPLVGAGQDEVEECDERALELGAAAGVDGGGPGSTQRKKRQGR